MSRIGKQPVLLPAGVTATVTQGVVSVTGPKGTLSLALHPHATVTVEGEAGSQHLAVVVADPVREDRAVWGTMRALVAQMVKGVTQGYTKSLELNGVGFKMALRGDGLAFSLGFSHEITYALPQGVVATIEGNILKITGADAQAVGRVAAEIRAFKKPEPYKGKGFRYTDEVIRRKAGKAAKGDK